MKMNRRIAAAIAATVIVCAAPIPATAQESSPVADIPVFGGPYGTKIACKLYNTGTLISDLIYRDEYCITLGPYQFYYIPSIGPLVKDLLGK